MYMGTALKWVAWAIVWNQKETRTLKISTFLKIKQFIEPSRLGKAFEQMQYDLYKTFGQTTYDIFIGQLLYVFFYSDKCWKTRFGQLHYVKFGNIQHLPKLHLGLKCSFFYYIVYKFKDIIKFPFTNNF